MIQKQILILASVLLIVICGCVKHPKPSNAIGIVRVTNVFTTLDDKFKDMPGRALLNGEWLQGKYQQVITPEGTYYYTKLSSGATILSPRFLLLSDHQTRWTNGYFEGYIQLPDHGGLYHAHQILQDQDPLVKTSQISDGHSDDGFGWEILQLDEPLADATPIRFAEHIERFYGKTCYIPISVASFLDQSNGNTPAHLNHHYRDGNRLFIRAQVVHPKNADNDSVKFFRGNKVVAYYSLPSKLRSASGYPLLVYDELLKEWLSLGVIVGGESDSKSAHHVWSMRPTREQIEQAGLIPNKVFAPCSDCETKN